MGRVRRCPCCRHELQECHWVFCKPEVLYRDGQQDRLGLGHLVPSSMVFLGEAVATKSSLEQFFCCLFSALPPGRELLGQPLAVVLCERRAEKSSWAVSQPGWLWVITV